MAFPRLKEGDIIEISFHNLDDLYVDKRKTVYAARTRHKGSALNAEWVMRLLTGDKYIVREIDRHFITISHNRWTTLTSSLRVQRHFVESVRIIERFTTVTVGGVKFKIPTDSAKSVDCAGNGTLTPSSVRSLLKDIKKFYIGRKKKIKKKAVKKEKPKTHKKGTNFTKSAFGKFDRWRVKEEISVDVVPVDWDDSPEDLSADELYLVYTGKLKGTRACWNFSGEINILVREKWVTVRRELIKSITLASAWTEPPKVPERVDQTLTHPRFGARRKTKKIFGHLEMLFYEKGIAVGCKEFSRDDIRTVYKALCKVYGTPE